MQRPHYTTPVSTLTRADCETLIRLALYEDSPNGDVTSDSIFPPVQEGRGVLRTREQGVLCGLPVVEMLLVIDAEKFRPITMETAHRDGDSLSAGAEIAMLSGSLAVLLRLERVILNFLQYLSGISSVVAGAVERAGDRVFVLDTRKTLPGYRRLAKYAVFCGGGVNHRIHLSDMAMIKDNHIAASGGIRAAVDSIRGAHPGIGVEIEVDRLDQLPEALAARPQVLLLDNMRDAELRAAVESLARIPEGQRPLVELSGGWTPDELRALQLPIQVGVSMGYLTHTTRFLDIGLDIEPGEPG